MKRGGIVRISKGRDKKREIREKGREAELEEWS